MAVFSKREPARYNWSEPFQGALNDFVRFAGARILWITILAFFGVLIYAFYYGDRVRYSEILFIKVWSAFLGWLLFGLLPRDIVLTDSYLGIYQGKGFTKYRYSNISYIEIHKGTKHQWLAIFLHNGKRRNVYFNKDIALPKVISFLSEHGVKSESPSQNCSGPR
jgi:hypothetical protein